VDFESTYKLASENVADEKHESRSSLKKSIKETLKKKDAAKNKSTSAAAKSMGNKQNGYSSESESENECTSIKHRKKGRVKTAVVSFRIYNTPFWSPLKSGYENSFFNALLL
jgi:hypothetical protein